MAIVSHSRQQAQCNTTRMSNNWRETAVEAIHTGSLYGRKPRNLVKTRLTAKHIDCV